MRQTKKKTRMLPNQISNVRPDLAEHLCKGERERGFGKSEFCRLAFGGESLDNGS